MCHLRCVFYQLPTLFSLGLVQLIGLWLEKVSFMTAFPTYFLHTDAIRLELGWIQCKDPSAKPSANCVVWLVQYELCLYYFLIGHHLIYSLWSYVVSRKGWLSSIWFLWSISGWYCQILMLIKHWTAFFFYSALCISCSWSTLHCGGTMIKEKRAGVHAWGPVKFSVFSGYVLILHDLVSSIKLQNFIFHDLLNYWLWNNLQVHFTLSVRKQHRFCKMQHKILLSFLMSWVGEQVHSMDMPLHMLWELNAHFFQ